jgi:hypothetical protein
MTRRGSCPPAPGLREDAAAQFAERRPNGAQRRAIRGDRHGRRLPRARNQTLPGLAGTAPVLGAQAPPAPRRQGLRSASAWDAAARNDRRRALRRAAPATRPHDEGRRLSDEPGARKDGARPAQVAQQ